MNIIKMTYNVCRMNVCMYLCVCLCVNLRVVYNKLCDVIVVK